FSKNIFDLLALTAAMYIGWLTSGNKIDFCSGLLIPVISLTIGITLRVGLHFYINAMLVNTGRKFIFSDTETANLIQDKDSLFFKLNLKIRSNITCSPTEYKARDEELDAIVKL